MELKTYRARSMHEALTLVRQELGPDAAVLHTREVPTRALFGLIRGVPWIEVTASAGVNVPSRLPPRVRESVLAYEAASSAPSPTAAGMPPATGAESGHPLEGQISDLQKMVRQLCQRSQRGPGELPESLFRLFTELIDADVGEELARELVERVRRDAPAGESEDCLLARARVARLIESEIQVAGPIAVTPGRRRLIALVGPTGVGKTTTIAKLAANFRLKEKRRVGLITVDTYRIAAVEQLRTYADIIDLPMQVVSSPREMHHALARLAGLDLILMDTAGRSARDEIKIQELKAFLSEAGADEVHLVLSSVASARTLQHTAERFSVAGTTSLILTKLDEATGLGNVLSLLRSSRLPLSYLTNGQNVPDDIEVARAGRVAQWMLEGANMNG
jgi:flagellar biosynthesis protein FlhF